MRLLRQRLCLPIRLLTRARRENTVIRAGLLREEHDINLDERRSSYFVIPNAIIADQFRSSPVPPSGDISMSSFASCEILNRAFHQSLSSFYLASPTEKESIFLSRPHLKYVLYSQMSDSLLVSTRGHASAQLLTESDFRWRWT